jgi:hypothetical protein
MNAEWKSNVINILFIVSVYCYSDIMQHLLLQWESWKGYQKIVFSGHFLNYAFMICSGHQIICVSYTKFWWMFAKLLGNIGIGIYVVLRKAGLGQKRRTVALRSRVHAVLVPSVRLLYMITIVLEEGAVIIMLGLLTHGHFFWHHP